MTTNSNLDRSAGVLLHLTSLPGRYGIGELGREAFAFAEWLSKGGFTCWQVLPLGHTGFGDSPYQCFSAFAGNPLLISTEGLIDDGLISHNDAVPFSGADSPVNYGDVFQFKQSILRKAWSAFQGTVYAGLQGAFEDFKRDPQVALWLDDYALFMSLKDANDGQCWAGWATSLKNREPDAMATAKAELADFFGYYQFVQFVFYRQWEALKTHCNALGVQIIGDLPIYVAYDSADTWANQGQFQLDKKGAPTAVAGVPPDYFSKTGQFWGNPLYDWAAMKKDGYQWWVERLSACFGLFDVVRLDHFRGFFGYWSIPADAETAAEGGWIKGPGLDFFNEITTHFPNGMPMIAEDLGEISDDVHEGRKALNMPGMKILQFAWNPKSVEPMIPDFDSRYLPHQIEECSVVYTGTHDNDTTCGWWKTAPDNARKCLQVYLSVDGWSINIDLMRAALAARSRMAIIPMQDILGLDSKSRMNTPGLPTGNWSWRCAPAAFSDETGAWLKSLLITYERTYIPEIATTGADAAKKKKPLY